ncbi:IS200/IS605 family transposase [candidate division KSB1 bacterium]|nr:IS200/IS605 family transposase [candidate division KSB1 bacterium]
MAFWRLYYHFVWGTKDRLPMITPEVERELYGYLIGKAAAHGCYTHALGGVENHVHAVASIPPKMALAEYVQKMKGSSAHHLNHCGIKLPMVFVWQRGYGVLSLGKRNLPWVVQYVLNQKEHHRESTVHPALEHITEEDDGPALWNEGQATARIEVIRKPSYEQE